MTFPCHSHQNSRAERANRTLKDKMRTIFAESKVPETFWPLTLQYVTFTLNRLPTTVLAPTDMMQPEGFNDGSGKVCRLKKSLYGLKQASCWNKKSNSILIKAQRTNSGFGIYFKRLEHVNTLLDL